MPRDTVREGGLISLQSKTIFQIFFWGWEGVGVGSSPIWEGSQVPRVSLRLGSRKLVMVQNTEAGGYMYVLGEAGSNQVRCSEARVPTAGFAGGRHTGLGVHTVSRVLAVFQSSVSCRRKGLDAWGIFIFWMVSKAECFLLASGAERTPKTSQGGGLASMPFTWTRVKSPRSTGFLALRFGNLGPYMTLGFQA